MKSITLELISIHKLMEQGGPCPFSMPETYLNDKEKFDNQVYQVYDYLNMTRLSSDASLIDRSNNRFSGELRFRKFNEHDALSILFNFKLVIHI
ncbi:g342 [Yersinia phage phiR1-37]|uniref:hypothetical protein n=1 Tax=Yersinia phage phiR1-37 TaxID=331278 RepID=UPI00022DBE01|nr:hypothetical protein phiR1-37_gp342 [Yersinia phage phiR1-37]CCE26365.1 g342 [Yersinia phage phiR1-37]